MSLHRSLKTQPGALNEHRNVLTRAERIARLMDQGQFETDDDSPLNLPKVANRATAKKKKAAAEKTEEGAEAPVEQVDSDATAESSPKS